MKRTFFGYTALASAIAVMLAGCSRDPVYVPQPQVQQMPTMVTQPAAAPVIINQPAHDNTGSMLAAGALGYMVGSAGNNGARGYEARPVSSQKTTIVNKTVIVNKAAHAPVMAPAPARSSFSGASYGAMRKSSGIGSSKTTSFSSRSSFSSSRSTRR